MLALVPVAGAHPGDWYVTRELAQRSTLRVFKTAYPSVPMQVRCLGWGGSLAPKYQGGPRFYKHFKCEVEADLPRSTKDIRVTFHVINKSHFVLTDGWTTNGRDLGSYPLR